MLHANDIEIFKINRRRNIYVSIIVTVVYTPTDYIRALNAVKEEHIRRQNQTIVEIKKKAKRERLLNANYVASKYH